ncbi:response regulator [Halarcobacter sp.]|uniref:response regulator n=1 Tax=Halarcobacter sp. TaxID=2321133 RepID=UPI002AA7B348|nr:response regulator [Halarcobacter sp.]
MSNLQECSFNKDYLSVSTILFVENDENVRIQNYEIFSALFKKVIVAQDIQDAIKLYRENRTVIDIVLTDMDFPNYKGIEILSEIRKLDWEIPILITTTFSDMNLLVKAIKFNLTNYIVKPIQLNTTLKIISEVIKRKHQKKELATKNNELRQFMAILDSCNIVCEIDLNFKITSVNDSFLINSGFEIDELIGLDFNDKLISYNCEIPQEKIIELLKSGKTWTGLCKKINKKGALYYTHSTILPIFFNDGRIKKFIEFSTLISKYENEILSLRKHIFLLKSENLKTNSELKKEKEYYSKLAKSLQEQVDENVNNAQKLLFELYEVKKQNNILREKLKTQEDRVEEIQISLLSGN